MFQVLDENDNNPQFVSIPSNWSVRENSPIGKKMMTRISDEHVISFLILSCYRHCDRQRGGLRRRHRRLWSRDLLAGSAILESKMRRFIIPFLRKVSRSFALLQGLFSIDPESGAIIVMDRLDREEQQSYTLVLEAWDNYKFGYAAGESRNAFQQVT